MVRSLFSTSVDCLVGFQRACAGSGHNVNTRCYGVSNVSGNCDEPIPGLEIHYDSSPASRSSEVFLAAEAARFRMVSARQSAAIAGFASSGFCPHTGLL